MTHLAEPEVIFSLSDFQRVVVEEKSGPQMVETVSQDEAEEMIAETRLLPKVNYLLPARKNTVKRILSQKLEFRQ